MIKRYWKYIAGLGLFLAAIIWCLVAVYSSQVAANIATIVGAIVAAIGLGGIYWQLHHNARQAKRQRTFELISKHYDHNFVQFTVQASAFIANEKIKEKAKVTQFFDNDVSLEIQLRTRCLVLFDFYEDISQMYNDGLIDKAITIKALRGSIKTTYSYAEPIIKAMRTRFKNNRIYQQWEFLYEEIKRLDD